MTSAFSKQLLTRRLLLQEINLYYPDFNELDKTDFKLCSEN